MDILGPVPNTDQGSQFVVVMADRYTKLTEAIPTTKTNVTTVACILLECLVANCSIPSRLLTDNGAQFVSRCFVAVCNTLGANNVPTAEYNPQTNGQVELFNSTLITPLCVRTPNRLGHMHISVNVRLQSKRSQVHQRVIFQAGAYANSNGTGHRCTKARQPSHRQTHGLTNIR